MFLENQKDLLLKLNEKLINLVDSASVPEIVKSYARPEYLRGIEYHQKYLSRLSMNGERVLDAGCGVGNWTIALSSFYEKVFSLEFNKDRLAFTKLAVEVANIDSTLVYGSIESLPFEDNFFDGVFCNGVIFLTDYKKSMSELARVLKPGGMMYISFDEMPWWDHLIIDRGPKEPHLIPMSCEMLINHAADLLDRFSESCSANDKRTKSLLFIIYLLTVFKSNEIDWLKKIRIVISLLKPLLLAIRVVSKKVTTDQDMLKIFFDSKFYFKSIQSVVERVYRYGTKAQVSKLICDFLKFLEGESCLSRGRRGYCINKTDMEFIVEKLDLRVLGTCSEGTINLHSIPMSINPIYEVNLGVSEMVIVKPMRSVDICLEFYKENARSAASKYSSITLKSFLSNISDKTDIGFMLWQQHRDEYKFIDSTNFLNSLLISICINKKTQEEKFFAIYQFLQDSLFHHPVIQLTDELHGIGSIRSIEIIQSGIGRCGHVALVASDLYKLAGYEAKIRQLNSHICCEVFFENRWRVVDADIFKAGIFPINYDGSWATLEDLSKNPTLLDKLPAIGHQLSNNGAWSKNFLNKHVQGYTDIGCGWERPYISYLYFGGQSIRPASPPKIRILNSNSEFTIIGEVTDLSIIDILIVISSSSRGWKYSDFPDATYLKPMDSEIKRLTVTPDHISSGVVIGANYANMYLNMYARNKYSVDNPEVYLWPGEEFILSL